MDKDGNRTVKTPVEDVNLNVIRNLHVPCKDINKLNEHFSENVTSLVFHREISVVNLIHILRRCSKLETVHLDCVKLNYPDNPQKLAKLRNTKIILKHLKQMTITFIHQNEGISNTKPVSLHSDTLPLFKFIEMITFGSLEEVDMICSSDQLLMIPLPAAFVPNYTFQRADSLVEFLYNNRCTLRELRMGPAENEKLFITFQLPEQDEDVANTDEICDHTFRKMAEFVNRAPTKFEMLITAHNHPLPQWWTCILEHQTTLKHMSLTLMDPEVLTAALATAESCCNSLTVLHLRILGKDMHINLEKLNRCTKIATMSLTVHECHIKVSNFDLLPESIKRFKISGITCETLSEFAKSLPNLEALTLCLNKFDYPDVKIFSIVNWPVFEILMDFRCLEFIVIEAEEISLDWNEIYEWSKSVEWCTSLTRNTLEEIARDEIHIRMLPIVHQQEACVESGLDLNASGSESHWTCFGLWK